MGNYSNGPKGANSRPLGKSTLTAPLFPLMILLFVLIVGIEIVRVL